MIQKEPNDDYIKLIRLKQQKQYIESDEFDPLKTDIEKAKEYLEGKTEKHKNEDIEDNELIKLANNFRSEELINERLEWGNGYVDLQGQNCSPDNGTCEGWDGEGRCQCGNRRVSWVDLDEVYFINDGGNFYAEAY